MARVLVILWFAISFSNAVLGNFALVVWLRVRGVRFPHSSAGNPGYVLNRYRDWCEQHDLSARRVVIYSYFSIIDVLLSSPIAILILAGGHH
uniref:Uncharacterized protein n=1 Tax=mine drainage metagenome TaxID=410659 RepID=E6QGI0_9ZZZZ